MRNIDLQDISDMQEIKNEYDCIPVPEELESKVRAAIQKARLQKRKENSWIMKTRKIVVGVGATRCGLYGRYYRPCKFQCKHCQCNGTDSGSWCDYPCCDFPYL